MAARIVLLVPRRKDDGPRDALWAWCRARWERYHPDLRIVEGEHTEGPFNRSAAINTAARLAGDWQLGIVIDSDIFLRVSQVEAAIAMAKRTGRVTWAHTRWRGFHEDHTARTLKFERDFGPEIDQDDMDVFVERTNPLSWSCCFVVPRPVWDDLGGFDERFIGWGYEDHAFRSAVMAFHGYERLPGDVYHLHHARTFGLGRADKAFGEYTAEAITNARLGRRYMVAVIRDHGIGDQPGEAHLSPDDQARHIRNLTRDDEKLSNNARRLRLPEWDDWWPTLEELVAGSKAYREQRDGVTVIVRSGGEPATWPERSSYLRESLASLNARVRGVIPQRLIYSDWGDEFRPELEAIAAEAGFRVVGEGHHGYSAGVARLWRYIAKRVQTSYVLLAEDDFRYERDVDLTPMVRTLQVEPNLRQIALLRGPYYERERKAGILGWDRGYFTPAGKNGDSRIDHRLFWTMNPSLVRTSITNIPWPQEQSSERVFGDSLLRDPKATFAFWGNGEPWIAHLGEVRASDRY